MGSTSLFRAAADLLLRKDTASDFRAAVQFNVGTIAVFPATASGGARPDPCVDKADRDKHYDAPADVVFVSGGGIGPMNADPNNFQGPPVGLTDDHDWHQILIDATAAQPLPEVIAHEMGHGVRLEHWEPWQPWRAIKWPRVMADPEPTHVSGYVEITLYEADKYD